jgi:valyl-tRNA synthetase
MLHPLMPFITEELWNAMPVLSEVEGGKRPYELIVAKWPQPEAQVDPHAKAEIDWLIRLITGIRSVRTELNVPPGAKLIAKVSGAQPITLARLSANLPAAIRLARVKEFHELRPEFGVLVTPDGKDRGTIPAYLATEGGAAQIPVDEATFILPLEDVIDVRSEKTRLDKAVAATEKERDSLAQRLANPNFTERAKPEAVEKARADHEAKSAEAERLRAALERLG